jgi:antitoxin PrlF
MGEAESRDERRARILEAIESVRGSMKTGFATTDEYMDFIRPYRNDPV